MAIAGQNSQQPSGQVVRQVVVLGAGLAGLSATAALARRAESVLLLDQDELSRVDEARRGVPQSGHVHLLLPAGLAALEHLFPGIEGDLREAGAVVLRDPEDFVIYMANGALDLARLNPEFVLIGATRPLIEGVVRERVRSLANVRVRGGLKAVGLASNSAGLVTGVQVRRPGTGSQEEAVPADLVVDATGRGSRSPRWLEGLGYEAPSEEIVRVDVRYTTRLFRRTPGRGSQARNVLVAPPPGEVRGGVALAVEGDRWIVTLTGLLGEQAPGDLDGFLAYARSLSCQEIYAIAAREEPIGESLTGSFPANSRRRYDRLRRFPGKFVVLGDALTPFNPTYAQGMSMAAIEALELGAVLDRVGAERVGPAFYRATRPRIDDAWAQAVDNDLRHPEVVGTRDIRWHLINRYSKRLLPLAHRDPVVGRAFFDVMGLLAPGPSLLRPSVAFRVLMRGGKRSAVTSTTPARGGD